VPWNCRNFYVRTTIGLVIFIAVTVSALAQVLAPGRGHSEIKPRLMLSAETRGLLGLETGPLPPADNVGIRVEVVREQRFAWPALGPLTSYFGAGHPTGIDIGLDYGVDSPILASAAGTVSFAGGSACCSYGLHVVLEHEGGPSAGSGHSLSTLYGHLSQIMVEEGQEVRQGGLLGLGGDTGDSDGKHLHFEVHEEGLLVDPLRFLPVERASPSVGNARSVDCSAQPIYLAPGSALTLRLSGGGLEGFEMLGATLGASGADAGLPQPEVEASGDRAVRVRMAVVPRAAGQVVHYDLETTLRRGEEQVVIACQLDLRVMRTLSNSDATIAGYRRKYSGSPTPGPTATATLWRPSATPAKSAVPTRPPGGGPTSTPRAPRPLSVPTRTTGR